MASFLELDRLADHEQFVRDVLLGVSYAGKRLAGALQFSFLTYQRGDSGMNGVCATMRMGTSNWNMTTIFQSHSPRLPLPAMFFWQP